MAEFIKEGSVWKKADEISEVSEVENIEETGEADKVEENVVEDVVGNEEEIIEDEVLDDTREFVRQQYRDILGRDPYPDDLYGLNYYAKELEAGGSRERFSVALVVRKCYLDVLLRDPFPDDMGGLNNYVEEISSGRTTRGGLLGILERSQEYQEKFNMGINSMGKAGERRVAKTNPSRRNKVAIDIMFPGLGRKRENKKIKVSPSPTGSSEGIEIGGGRGVSSGGSAGGMSGGGSELVYCMMGGNKLHEIKGYIETVLPYVDGFVYIDSHSTDGTLEYMKGLLDSNGGKIVVIEKDWEDKFSAFRNHYLDYLRGIGYKGFVVTSDTDEHFPIETLSQLRTLIQNAKSYTGVSFRAYDVTLTDGVDDNGMVGVVTEGLSNPGYYKHLMFRFYPDLKYIGEPHETLSGHKIIWAQTELVYRHSRSKLKVYWRAVENFWISNSNRYSKKWAEYRQLCSQNGIMKFDQLREKFVDGTLPGNIEDWIMAHKNDDSDSGDSEVREMAKLYFEILHSEKISAK